MFDSIARIIEEMIPSVSPDALKEFKKDFGTFKFDSSTCTSSPNNKIVFQGDIIKDVPFVFYSKDGVQKKKTSFGMMLSHTCDMANLKKNVIFAFCIPASAYTLSNSEDAKNQRISNLMLLPTRHLLDDDLLVDFNLITTYSSQFVHTITKNRNNHLVTLGNLGNFLFLTKLTVHFFRSEILS